MPAISGYALLLAPIGVFTVGTLALATCVEYGRSARARFAQRRDALRRTALAKYAALSLTPESMPEDINRVLSMICWELDLKFLEVRFHSGTRGIFSYPSNEAPDPAARSNGVGKLVVKTTGGKRAEVFYMRQQDAPHLDRPILEASLARIFGQVNDHVKKERAQTVSPSET